MSVKGQYLYRYVLEYWEGNAKLSLRSYLIIKRTPQGYWIETGHNRKKWVSDFARARWAHPQEREALKHYIRRKTYRNHCIMDEMDRNDITIIEAKRLLQKHDKQGNKPTTKGSSKLDLF